jgi:hypothetical protein
MSRTGAREVAACRRRSQRHGLMPHPLQIENSFLEERPALNEQIYGFAHGHLQ